MINFSTLTIQIEKDKIIDNKSQSMVCNLNNEVKYTSRKQYEFQRNCIIELI